MGSREEAERVMLRLEEAVALVSRSMGTDIGMSGGLAVWPADGATVEMLMETADCRLYKAKQSKRRHLSEDSSR